MHPPRQKRREGNPSLRVGITSVDVKRPLLSCADAWNRRQRPIYGTPTYTANLCPLCGGAEFASLGEDFGEAIRKSIEAASRRGIRQGPTEHLDGMLSEKQRVNPRGTPRSGHAWTPKMRPTKDRRGKAIVGLRSHKEGTISSLGDAVPKPLGFNAFRPECVNPIPADEPGCDHPREAAKLPQLVGRIHCVHVWPDFRCPLRSMTPSKPVRGEIASRPSARRVFHRDIDSDIFAG